MNRYLFKPCAIRYLLALLVVAPCVAGELQNSAPSRAQIECEKAARESQQCGPNYPCAESKLKDAERSCIQWIRENTPKPIDTVSRGGLPAGGDKQ